MVKASVIWDAGVFLGYTRQRLGAVGSALLKWQMPLLHRILWDGAVAQLAEQRAFNPEVVGSIPTGPTDTEGTNRIIKAVKRQGFGYTNPENYRTRVLYRCA